MTLAQIHRTDGWHTGRSLGPLQGSWSEASSPGIPLVRFQSDVTTYGVPAAGIADPWEQCSLGKQVSRFIAELCSASPYVGTGATAAIVTSVVMTAEPQEHPPYWKMAVQDDAHLIARIRSSLSLQMKELAEAVGVQRPTVYAWLKGQSMPQKVNRERLHCLYRVAQHWDRVCHRPLGRHLREAGPEGTSVLDMLCSRTIGQVEITRRLEAVARRLEAGQRTAQASVRAMATKHGIPLEKVRDRQDEFDVLTGKRFPED